MDQISLHQILSIYIWFGLAAFIFMLALIARFYERLSGQPTYYRLFAIPVLFFAGATMRLSSLNQVAGDVWGDLLLLGGGITLAALCWHVYRLMTSGR